MACDHFGERRLLMGSVLIALLGCLLLFVTDNGFGADTGSG